MECPNACILIRIDISKNEPEHLAELVYAYNVTPHSSTGYSPYHLLFAAFLQGQEPDAYQGQDWQNAHKERLRDANLRAKEYAESKNWLTVAQQEEKVYCPAVEVGQHVYLRYQTPGRNKIQDAWSSTIKW